MLYLDLSLSIPPINCSHLWNVTWVFHWETRRQHHHTLCCLSVHGTQVYRNQLPMGWGRDRKGPWRTAPLLPVCRSVSRRANCEAGTLCHHSQFIDRGNSKLNHVVGWGADVNENMVTEICAKEGLPVLLYWKNKLYYKKKKILCSFFGHRQTQGLKIDYWRRHTAGWVQLIYDPGDLMEHFVMLFCSDSLWICTSGDIYIYGKW